MNAAAWRALLLAGGLTLLLALLHWAGIGLWILLGLALIAGAAALFVPWIGVRWLDEGLRLLRAARWRREEGHHHAFAGIALHVEDDGREVWIAGADLLRVLRRHEADDVLAARHAGRWRRDKRGRLLLRVDAVIEQLAHAPGRMDPRTVQLRRYLEREVLFPAQQRRRRGG